MILAEAKGIKKRFRYFINIESRLDFIDLNYCSIVFPMN